MAQRRAVRGMTAQCCCRKDSMRGSWRLPTSRSIHPVALWMRSSLSPSSSRASSNESQYSPFRMNVSVDRIDILRSHRLLLSTSLQRMCLGSASVVILWQVWQRLKMQAPMMLGAERSTRSQLLTALRLRRQTWQACSSSFLNLCSISSNAMNRSSCNLLPSSCSTSAHEAALLAAAILRHSGLESPAKVSPSPYWPGPVLKKRIICLAFSAHRSALTSAWMACSDINQQIGFITQIPRLWHYNLSFSYPNSNSANQFKLVDNCYNVAPAGVCGGGAVRGDGTVGGGPRDHGGSEQGVGFGHSCRDAEQHPGDPRPRGAQGLHQRPQRARRQEARPHLHRQQDCRRPLLHLPTAQPPVRQEQRWSGLGGRTQVPQQDLEELRAQRLMDDSSTHHNNMHWIANRTAALLLKAICLLLCFLPVLPQFAPRFSQAYADILSAAHRPRWWVTCQQQSQLPREVCPYHALPSQHVNATEPISHEHAEEQMEEGKEEEAVEVQEYGWSELLVVVVEQAWAVCVEAAAEWGRRWAEWAWREQAVEGVWYHDNFASLNGGAIVLRKSSHKIHNVQSILEDSSEKYLYSDENLPIEVVIALKEEVKIERISIRSNEAYSSVVREFELEGALNLQEAEGETKTEAKGEAKAEAKGEQKGGWFRLLSAIAKNHGGEQSFRSKNKVVRFLRLRIISKHGNWKYFTLTQLKVYGEGLFTEALVDYQSAQSSEQGQVRSGSVELATDLGFAYDQLTSSGGEKKPEQNVLSFLLEKVGTLSKIHEFELHYMQNLSVRLENASRSFKQHINRYNLNTFNDKLHNDRPRQARLEQKIADLEATLTKRLHAHNQSIEQLKYAELSAPQACPNHDDQLTQAVLQAVVASVLISLVLSAVVGYCCLRCLRDRQQTHQQTALAN